MLILELRICQTQIEKETKEYMKNYYSKGKKMLNHLINCVKELENVWLYKYIFKFRNLLNLGNIK